MIDKAKNQAKALYAQFKQVTNNQIERHKDSSVIKLLEKTADTFQAVTKTLDIFLKSHGVDVKDMYDKGRESAKNAYEKLIEVGTNVKEKGVRVSVTDGINTLKEKYKAFSEVATGPPGETVEGKLDRLKGFLVNKLGGTGEELDADGKPIPKEGSLLGKVKSFAANHISKFPTNIFSKKKTTEEAKEETKEETTPEESTVEEAKEDVKEEVEEKPKKGWLRDKYDRMAKRRKEIAEEKDRVKEAGKKDKKPGWLSDILGKIGSVGTLLVSGIGAVATAIGTVATAVVSGLGTVFKYVGGKIIAALTAKAAVGAADELADGVELPEGRGRRGKPGVVGRGVRNLGQIARGVATAGSVLGKGALTAAKVGATAVGTVLSAKVLAPVIAVVAIAGGGYLLYRHLTRGAAGDTIYGKLTRLRLLMYGYGDQNKDYYNRIFDLEMFMKDFVVFQNGKVEIKNFTPEAVTKIMDLFNISKQETEKFRILNEWLSRRFLPAYRAFMQALYSVNSAVYLDKIENLKVGDIHDLMTRFSVPTVIYNTTQIPVFSNPTIPVGKEQVDRMIEVIMAYLRPKLEATTATSPNPTPTPAPVVPPPVVRPPDPPAPRPQPVNRERTLPPDTEGEPAPPNIKAHGNDLGQTSAKLSGKINLASGSLMPGGLDLTGLQLHNIERSQIENLDPNMRELFTGMAREYHSLTGKNIPITEGFRTYEQQADLFRRFPDRAARPGNSVHEFGLAVDINSEHARELDRMGLLRKYGFTAAIGGEQWHLEPIGVSLNPQLARRDPKFRADAIASSPGKGGGGYGFRSDSRLKRRNIPYQLSIYNTNSNNPIDLEKLKANSQTALVSAQNSIAQNSTSVNNRPTTPIATGTTTPQRTLNNTPTTPIVTGTTTPQRTLPPDAEGEPAPPRIGQQLTPPSTSDTVVRNNTALNNNNTVASGVGANTDISRTGQLNPPEAIAQASSVVGVNQDVMMTVAKMESSLNPNARASTSSASGLFQIVNGTWNELATRHGAKYGITSSSNRFDAYHNSLMGAEYIKSNLRLLPEYRSLGIDDTLATYLAHFLGPGGARRFISAYRSNPDAPMSTMVSSSSYASNRPSMGGRTGRQFLDGLRNRINTARNKPVEAFAANWRTGRSGPTVERARQMTEGSASTPTAPRPGPTREATAARASSTAVNNTSANTNLFTNPSQSTPNAPTQANRVTIAPPPVTTPPTASTTRQNSTELMNKDISGILNEQLTTLVTISGLLKTMNSNLDMTKLGETISNSLKNHLGTTPQPSAPRQAPQQQASNVTPTTVDMARRSTTT